MKLVLSKEKSTDSCQPKGHGKTCIYTSTWPHLEAYHFPSGKPRKSSKNILQEVSISTKQEEKELKFVEGCFR